MMPSWDYWYLLRHTAILKNTGILYGTNLNVRLLGIGARIAVNPSCCRAHAIHAFHRHR